MAKLSPDLVLMTTAPCGACEGSGIREQLHHDYYRPVPCDDCEGTGMVLTEFGKELARFLRLVKR